MADVTITLIVDTTKLFLDPLLPLDECCTLAQIGGSLRADTNSDLTNYISDVNIGDTITWNGIANSTFLATNVGSVMVNITAVTVTTVFGQAQLLPLSLIPGATGGTAVQGQVSFGSEGDTVTYTISFNFITSVGDDVITSETYNIDPKIRVHSTS